MGCRTVASRSGSCRVVDPRGRRGIFRGPRVVRLRSPRSVPLVETPRRFVQYNGGVGPEQLRWLEQQLADASRAGQRVVAFGHVPLHPAVTDEKALLWNYDEVGRVGG